MYTHTRPPRGVGRHPLPPLLGCDCAHSPPSGDGTGIEHVYELDPRVLTTVCTYI
jgi:hypothetical protein